MIRRRLASLYAIEDDLPRAVAFGRRLTYGALTLAVCALVGVGILANSKADRASEEALAARRDGALVVCALADAQRVDNPTAPPPSTDRGVYVARIWGVAFRIFSCQQFTDRELADLVDQLAPPTPSAAPPTPTRTPSTRDATPGG